jgi:hypothetical protein
MDIEAGLPDPSNNNRMESSGIFKRLNPFKFQIFHKKRTKNRHEQTITTAFLQNRHVFANQFLKLRNNIIICLKD